MTNKKCPVCGRTGIVSNASASTKHEKLISGICSQRCWDMQFPAFKKFHNALDTYKKDLATGNFIYCEWIKDIYLYIKDISDLENPNYSYEDTVNDIIKFYEDCCENPSLDKNELEDLKEVLEYL